MNRITRPWTGVIQVCCLLASLLLVGCAAPRTVAEPSGEAVRAEVRRALDQFSEVAGRGDLAAALAQFDDKADILLVGSDKGEVYKGRAAMEGWLGSLFKWSTFSWQMDRVDISHHGETAWAFVEGKMNVRDKTNGKLRFSAPYRFSAVLVRRGDGWAWRLFHGSAPGKE
jgi:ketosteroid isomerase-like protein